MTDPLPARDENTPDTPDAVISHIRIRKRTKTLAVATAATLFVVMAVSTVLGVGVLGHIGEVDTAWADYEASAARKDEVLHEITASFGYGGFIHDFKNFVLRREPELATRARQDLDRVGELIGEYEATGIDDDERAALATIRSVFEEYDIALNRAVLVSRSYIRPTPLDNLVEVDDSAAIAAIEDLHQINRAAREGVEARISSAVTEAVDLIEAGVIIAPVMLVAGFGFLLLLVRLLSAQATVIGEAAKRAKIEADSENAKVLRAVIDSFPGGLSAMNRDLELVASNETFYEVLDLPPDRFPMGCRYEDIIRYNAERGEYGPGDPEQQVRDRVELTLKFEAHRFEREAGNGRTLEISGQPMPEGGFVSVYTDVTERKVAEAALARNERMLRGVLEAAAESMIMVDSDLVVRSVNRAAEDLFDYGASRIVGQDVRILLPDKHADDIPALVDRHLETGEPVSTGRTPPLSGKRSNGKTFPMIAKLSSVESEEGPVYILLARDISEQIAAERHLRDNARDLAEARDAADQANTAKSSFLATMSHEIRTPMNGILGMADVLLGQDLDPAHREHVAMIRNSGNTLLAILNDILDLSKIEADRLEIETRDFNAGELLDEVLGFWAPPVRARGLMLSCTQPERPFPPLRGDPERIRQILANLMNNALKFTAEGEIALAADWSEGQNGDIEVTMSVTDSGEGISPEALPRLFREFSQADETISRTHGGTGLGLSICRRLCELMGGEISAESTPGQGSCFRFSVLCQRGELPAAVAPDAVAADDPVAADDAGKCAAHEPGPCPPDRQDCRAADEAAAPVSLHILVAEDNPVNQAVIRALLQVSGHRIDLVGDGRLAVEAAKSGEYDIVLMDIHMPDTDGVQATTEIRALDGAAGRVPIVAVTANAMKGDREKFLDAGMNGYVEKPIDQKILNDTIAACTGHNPDGSAGWAEAGGEAPENPESRPENEAALLDIIGDIRDAG